MDEKKSISDEEAKALLKLNDSRRRTIENIRSGGYERYIGWIFAVLIMLLSFLLKSDWSFSVLISLIVGFAGVQIWNQKRFDALVDFLEKEGVIHR